MSHTYLYADEAGNFDFRPHGNGASRYFILTTVALETCDVGDELLRLRRRLTIEGHNLPDHFHATEQSPLIRDEVFRVLGRHDFRIDATILEKAKAEPRVRRDERYFYQLAWFLHLKYVAPRVGGNTLRPLLVVAASIATKKKRKEFSAAVRRVADQVYHGGEIRSASWASASDPCLWVADYCSWAVQRKWERRDARAYDLIARKVNSEFDAWAIGKTRYY